MSAAVNLQGRGQDKSRKARRGWGVVFSHDLRRLSQGVALLLTFPVALPRGNAWCFHALSVAP